MNRSIIPYGKQDISEEDVAAVVDALNSEYLTQGPTIKEFEDAFKEYVGSKYAVAVSNGTAALHLSALAMDVKPGDNVITSPITFAATASCIRYCGGEVRFADIDSSNFLLDIELVRHLLETSPENTYQGIIPVDFAGRSVDLEKLKILAQEHNLWIIEDACHAPGGYFIDSQGVKQNCGSTNFADIAIFSFHPVKHIAAGEGGMITTNDEKIYRRLINLRTHGISRDESSFENAIELAVGTKSLTNEWPKWYMELKELGYNYRLTDIQAALGKSQLNRAKEGIDRRREIAKRYFEAFMNNSFIINQSGVIEGHAYHLYVIEVKDRLGLYNFLRERGIFAQVHYIPLHLMPYYQRLGWKKGDLPKAESYYSGCLSIPMYPSLSDGEVDFVIESINKFYRNGTKGGF